MATVAIGDIHGNSRALENLLEKILPEMRPADTLVFLGDFIDRGPDTKHCVDRIASLRASADFTVVPLMGNHEEWMLSTMRDTTRHSWLIGAEAFETIASYSLEVAVQLRKEAENAGPRLIMEKVELSYHLFFDTLPPSHIELFENLALFHRSDGVICVHAGLDLSGTPLELQDPRNFTWGPDDFPERYRGAESVVYGHWNNYEWDEDGSPKPRILENGTYGIDTVSSGVLTAIRFPGCEIVQSDRFCC
jgi:serine/threonine protein phosphatase 1